MKDDLMLHAREKNVQRMTRDGAVEENLATGNQKRISKREQDVSLDKITEKLEFHSGASKQKFSSKNKRKYYRSDAKGASKSDRIQKLEKKVDRADKKTAKAKGKLPKKVRIKHQRLYDEQTGRTLHRLRFENETIGKPSIPGRIIQSGVSKADLLASGTMHGKVHEDGDDNYAVGSLHSIEGAAESGLRTAEYLENKHISHQRKRVSRLEHKSEKAHVRLKFEKAVEENPDIKKSVKKKMQQKHQIKKEYRKAQKAAGRGQKTVGKAGKAVSNSTGQLANKLVVVVKNNKGLVATIAVCLLVVILLSSALTSCAAIFTTGGGAVTTSTYLSTDDAITTTNNAYTQLETGLQTEIDNIESTYPSYDEYRYNLDEISHDPYALTSYLTSKYGNFKAEDVSGYLQGLFDSQYELTVTRTVETRTRTETRTGYRTVHHTDGTTSRESYTYEVEVEYQYYILNVTLTNTGLDAVVRPLLNENQLKEYNIYQASSGNRSYLFGTIVPGNVAGGGISYEIPPEALADADFRAMIAEAEKYLGYPYVWGGSSPSTSFDCSGFVSWVINHSVGNVGRSTANGLLGACTYVSPADAKPGDLIFFQGTYNTSGASHVGIYVGNNMMIHCGNPIQYASTQTNYWQSHFLCYGRLN